MASTRIRRSTASSLKVALAGNLLFVLVLQKRHQASLDLRSSANVAHDRHTVAYELSDKHIIELQQQVEITFNGIFLLH
jgi:hypothetical protein